MSAAEVVNIFDRLDVRMGRARMMADRLTRQIILGRAARNAGHGSDDGARSPAGPARPPVDTVVVTEELGDGTKELRTPLGMKTARLRLPRVLRLLPDEDGRRLVALRYVTLQELVDAPNVCADLNSAGATGKISDGGATYRVGLAEELRAYQWAIGSGVALAPKSRRGRRRPVTDRTVVDLICLGGVDLSGVLRAHGWGLRASFRHHLEARLLAALDRMRDVEHWASKGD